jgi:hypothetical protein
MVRDMQLHGYNKLAQKAYAQAVQELSELSDSKSDFPQSSA